MHLCSFYSRFSVLAHAFLYIISIKKAYWIVGSNGLRCMHLFPLLHVLNWWSLKVCMRIHSYKDQIHLRSKESPYSLTWKWSHSFIYSSIFIEIAFVGYNTNLFIFWELETANIISHILYITFLFYNQNKLSEWVRFNKIALKELFSWSVQVVCSGNVNNIYFKSAVVISIKDSINELF